MMLREILLLIIHPCRTQDGQSMDIEHPSLPLSEASIKQRTDFGGKRGTPREK